MFGLVVGEEAGRLEVLGDIYIRLLQMTVLPYILFSLIGGLGALDMEMAKRIGIAGAGLILFLWLTTMIVLLTMPLAYPDWESASFFSSSLITPPVAFDALSLYIPANPFHVLANTIVPAVVVFSIAMGIALISVKEKDGLLLAMKNVSDALLNIASFVARLAPIGIFALTANAAGTLDFESLTRLQIYLWVYLGAWLVLLFFTLPMFVAWATPFSYRDVMRDARTAMVTAFAAGTVLVVLPMIAERSKALLEKYRLTSSEADTAIDVLVPTAYSFPSVGTLLGIGFILFAGWFVGSPLDVGQYPGFVLTGAVSAFGTMAVALPFMLDYFHLPSDLFQLYLVGSVITGRFATVLAAMHGVVISLLGASVMLGVLKRRGLFNVLGISVLVMGVAMWGLGLVASQVISYEYTGYESFVSMPPMESVKEERQVPLPEPLGEMRRTQPRLEVIGARGSLRVGFPREALPFAFRNKKGQPVGYDIDLMRVLARNLDVALEVVQVTKAEAAEALAEGRIDIFAGALAITAKRARKWTFSAPYLYQHVGLLVRDYRRAEFATLEDIRHAGPLRLGVLGALNEPLYGPSIRKYLKDVEIVPLETPRDFLTGKVNLDAMVYSAESGAAWTLIYPDFSVVVPQGVTTRMALGLVLPDGQEAFQRFINLWLEVEEARGQLERLKNYWIYGKVSKEGEK